MLPWGTAVMLVNDRAQKCCDISRRVGCFEKYIIGAITDMLAGQVNDRTRDNVMRDTRRPMRDSEIDRPAPSELAGETASSLQPF
jgi:hypothetical protein